MRSFLFLLLALLLPMLSCSARDTELEAANRSFAADLAELKEYFMIPGLAVLVRKGDTIVYEDYMGFADLRSEAPVDSSTVFPVASLTKIFSAVLLMKLVEEGRLTLDTPINDYLSDSSVSDAVLVEHVLTHTSQGEPGERFYYSSRFAWLTDVIEAASGKPFEDYLESLIIAPLGLRDTYLMRAPDQTDRGALTLARPYNLHEPPEGGAVEVITTDGVIEYGVSAAAGVALTARDLATFDAALDDNQVISEASKASMFTAFREDLPYGYGVFIQDFEGVEVIWAYGQYDSYSALFVKIPFEATTIVLLANNNLLSDPARLIYGDVTSSLFGISILKNYVYRLYDMPILDVGRHGTEVLAQGLLYRKKLLAQALAASFLARYDTDEWERSADLLHTVFERYPDVLSYADLSLLHTLSYLEVVAEHRGIAGSERFTEHLETVGSHLLVNDPENPYANYYLGSHYARTGDSARARRHFQRIVDNARFDRWWYTAEAENWLRSN